MKALVFLAALLVAGFAQAGELRSYDCRNGNDGMGGKRCVYEFSECIQTSCEEAAKCIVQQRAQKDENKDVTVYIADTTAVTMDSGEDMFLSRLQRHEENCNGRQCLTPMFVFTQIRKAEWGYKAGQCEPVIVQVIGDQSLNVNFKTK